jgi:hypothetical protein
MIGRPPVPEADFELLGKYLRLNWETNFKPPNPI